MDNDEQRDFAEERYNEELLVEEREDDDEALARRMALVIRDMLSDAARHLCKTDLAELNDVMFEAERRGWYRT